MTKLLLILALWSKMNIHKKLLEFTKNETKDLWNSISEGERKSIEKRLSIKQIKKLITSF